MNEQALLQEVLKHRDREAQLHKLEQLCGGDLELFERTRGLLEATQTNPNFDPPEHKDPTPETENDPTIELEATINPGQGLTNNEHNSDQISLTFLSPSEKPDSLGRLGHYDVQELVGHGAFGIVLKAFDEKLFRIVAIKVLAPELAASSPARKRFLREARSSASIRNENVVNIYSVEDEPTPYLVMEYIEGQTLQQKLIEHGPLSIGDALPIAIQIANGLRAAHQEDLIHRDIKPANILLEAGVYVRVKITDFGLARTSDDASVTQSGVIAGTPMFMSPEQVSGQRLDHRSDLFSFGSVLYEMLSGRPPFRAPSAIAVFKRVADDNPRPIQDLIPETPDWMCHIVERLHEKKPENRYQSIAEVQEVLSKCQSEMKANRVPEVQPQPAQGVISTQREQPHPGTPSRSQSGPAVAIAIGIALLAAVAAGLSSLFPSKPSQEKGNVSQVDTSPDPTAQAEPSGNADASVAKDEGLRSSEMSTDAVPATSSPALLRRLWGHKGKVMSCKFSPNGKLLASGGAGSLLVWELDSGTVLYELPAEKGVNYYAIAFSVDGSVLVSAPETPDASDSLISIWDVSNGKLAGQLSGHTKGIMELAFSPDGKTLLSCGHDHVIKMWDFKARSFTRNIVTPLDKWARSVVYSNDGSFAVGQEQVFVFGGDLTLSSTLPRFAGPIAYSPNGDLLAGATWSEGRTSIWDPNTEEELASWISHDGAANGIAFSPDSNVLVSTGGDGKVRFWDWKKQTTLGEASHDAESYMVAFSPQATVLASAGYDGVVKLWDVRGMLGLQERQLEVADGESSLRSSSDQRLLRTVDSGQENLYTVAFAPNGEYVASSGTNRVLVWNASSGDLVNRFTLAEGANSALAFSPDSSSVLAAPERGAKDWNIEIWNLATNESIGRLVDHTAGILEISFSHDGKTLISTSYDGRAILWDFEQRTKRLEIKTPLDWLRSGVSSSDGRIALSQEAVYIYDQDGEMMSQFDVHASPLCFSPDGGLLAGSHWQLGLTRVFDASTGEIEASWKTHIGSANLLTFTRDGNRLITAGSDKTVRIWDYRSRQLIAELQHDAETYGVALSPTGDTLASAGYDGKLRLWDISDLVEPRQ